MNQDEVNKMIDARLNNFTFELGEHLSQSVQGAVKLAVNGKVESMRQELRAYIVKDDEWKAKVEPVVYAFENLKWSGKLLLGIVVAVGTIAGAIITVVKLFKL